MAALRRVRAALRALWAGRTGREVRTWEEDARSLGLRPIAASFDTFYVLTPSGDVGWSNRTDFADLEPVHDERERNWLLYEVSRRYPDLGHLRPVRGPGDRSCSTCGGSGVPRGLPAGMDNIVCECGGLGWLPAGYIDPHRDQGV